MALEVGDLLARPPERFHVSSFGQLLLAPASHSRRRLGLVDAPISATSPAVLIKPWNVAGVRAGCPPGIVSQSIQPTTPAAAAAAVAVHVAVRLKG